MSKAQAWQTARNPNAAAPIDAPGRIPFRKEWQAHASVHACAQEFARACTWQGNALHACVRERCYTSIQSIRICVPLGCCGCVQWLCSQCELTESEALILEDEEGFVGVHGHPVLEVLWQCADALQQPPG